MTTLPFVPEKTILRDSPLEPCLDKTCNVRKKLDADKPVNPRGLIGVFIIRCRDRIT